MTFRSATLSCWNGCHTHPPYPYHLQNLSSFPDSFPVDYQLTPLFDKVHCPSQKHNCRKIDVSQLQGALGVMLMHRGGLVSGELVGWGLQTQLRSLTMHGLMIVRCQNVISIRHNQRHPLSELALNLHIIAIHGLSHKIKPFQILSCTINWKSMKCFSKDESYEKNSFEGQVSPWNHCKTTFAMCLLVICLLKKKSCSLCPCLITEGLLVPPQCH